ncbi:MAG TPA: hypothetical protein DIS68_07645, partial [Lachnospiraceae bacterium]|nr:hypothetical protein [Lachnospiraceae bacterium]
MENFLPLTVLILLLIVLIGFFNEKVTKLTYEISLMLFATVVGVTCTFIVAATRGSSVSALLSDVMLFDIEGFLMEGVLCFMLFAGSCHMRLHDF